MKLFRSNSDSSERKIFQLNHLLPHSNWRWRRKCIFSVICILCLFARQSWALPGDLDPTFGGAFGRYFINQEANEFDAANAVARQPDGKLVIAGTCGSGTSADICVLRRNVNGSADVGFGYAQGASRITASPGADKAVGIALQADGKIVVAGSCVAFSIRSFCITRLLADGTLDATFGNNGVVNQVVGAGDADPRALVIQPDGKIIVGGSCFDGTFNTLCATRFLPGGAFDNSFGIQGRRFFPTASELRGHAVALQSDGNILIAGSCLNGASMCVGRLTTSGSIDNSFGVTGIAAASNGNADGAYGVLVQPDGKILLAGTCPLSGVSAYCIARLDNSGNPDIEFGFPVGAYRLARYTFGSALTILSSIALQSDGRIVVAGTCLSTTPDFCLARLNDNGSLDQSFGISGVVKTNVIDDADFALAMLIQPDGKIVVVGQCTESSAPTDAAMCIARYEGGPFGTKNCSMDIDGDGVVLGTTDQLILSRIARGVKDANAIGGVSFAPYATRKTWDSMRSFLVTQCGIALP
jgi:uncharacterized delta-60 repeat protein